jgi:NO-binding membrane sensor protein with MHYT domain
MHFIGNRAIVLGNGDPSIQLVYASNWTVLSVFLPVIGLTIAFSAAEFSSSSPILHWAALTCTGIFAGMSVCGMHYLGKSGQHRLAAWCHSWGSRGFPCEEASLCHSINGPFG